MKNFKRMTAAIAATLMAATLSIPMATSLSASAATANTITITGTEEADTATHTYTLYKLFGGTATTANISDPSSLGALENVTWAWDGDADAETKTTAFISAITNGTTGLKDFTLTDEEKKTAAGVAKALYTYTTKEATSPATGRVVDADKAKALSQWLGKNASLLTKIGDSVTNGTFSNVTTDGYYIIVESALTGDNTVGSMTYHLLGTYKAETGAEINVKTSMPSVVKKVQENVKSDTSWNPENNEYGDKFNDVADYSISDMVPFKLIATLPSKIDNYDHYYIKFNDNLDKGFVAPTSVKVTVEGKDTETITISDGAGQSTDGNIKVTVTTDADTKAIKIDVEVLDVQKYKPADGSLADKKVTVEYDAKLDTDAVIGRPGNYNDVSLTFSNNPNNVGDGSSAPGDTGETPKDGVVVFTYELDAHKYDKAKETESPKPLLADAVFVLSNKEGKYLNIDDTTGEYSWVTVDTSAADFKWDTVTTVEKFKSTADEEIKIPGLDDGEYNLTEIAAPSGYNKLTAPLKLVIAATTANSQNQDAIGPNADENARKGTQLTEIKLTNGETGDTAKEYDTNNDAADDTKGGTKLTDGNVVAEIGNGSGTELPGTGGIGTTLFYVGGGCMVALAGVFLITKKRMNKKED